MDDLQHFVESKLRSKSLLGSRAHGAGYKEYESVDRGRGAAKITSSHQSSRSAGSDFLDCPRCNRQQDYSRSTSIASGVASFWHHALEKVDGKREWRNTSAKLSEAFERWSKAANDASGSCKEEKTEGDLQLSVEATVLHITKIGDTTQPQEITIETTEIRIPTQHDSIDIPPDSGYDNVTIKAEHIHNQPVVKIEVTETEPELDTTPVVTPVRRTRATSSLTSSPVTPDSTQSQIAPFWTPDTPESILRHEETANSTLGPSTPTPSFKFMPLPEDAFLPRFSSEISGRPRTHRAIDLPRPPSPRLRIKTGTFRRRSLSPNIQTDPRARLFPPDGVKIREVCHRVDYVEDSHGVVVCKEEDDTVAPSAVPILQLVPKEDPNAKAPERRTEFSNSLQVYDKAKNQYEKSQCSTWDYFNSDSTRCYGGTKATGKRCKFRTIKGREDSIREAIMKLEEQDSEADYDGCLRLVEELSQLTLCHNKRSKWLGHSVGASGISIQCKILLAHVRPYSNEIQVPAGNARLNATTRTITRLVPSPFSGFEVYQTKDSLSKNISTCLREYALKAVNINNTRNSGYIYVYRTDCVFGYIKIGRSQDINRRLKEWQRKCGHKISPVVGFTANLPYISRVEHLIHIELRELRRKQTKCRCQQPHEEWFETGEDKAKAVIAKWCAWMAAEPYDAKGRLKPQHQLELDDWCSPDWLTTRLGGGSEVAKQHIQPWEPNFELSISLPVRTLKLTSRPQPHP